MVGAIGLDEFNRHVLFSLGIKVVSCIGMSWSLIVKVYVNFNVFWEIILLSPEDLCKFVTKCVCLIGRHGGNSSVFQELVGKPNLC